MMKEAQIALSHEDVGLKILAKIKMKFLTRTESLALKDIKFILEICTLVLRILQQTNIIYNINTREAEKKFLPQLSSQNSY